MKKPVKRIIPKNKECPFCKAKTVPTWSESEKLIEYITARGRIMSATASGVCSRHQRMLAKAIKEARHLALVPFTVSAK